MSLRLVVRTVSELCVTLGALIVLFVVYVLFWTGVRADSAMDSEVRKLQTQWAAQAQAQNVAAKPSTRTKTATSGGKTATPAKAAAYHDGSAFAVMYIPRLGKGWHKPVLEDTALSTLKKGLAHYSGTARLGAVGNFAVAGHRRTYGDPLEDFPELRVGDKIVLTDGTTWYTYVIDRGPYRTLPTDVGVIDPVPKESGFTAPGRYLTLTTCDPAWGHSHRLIVWGHLDSTKPVRDGMPAALSG